MAHDGFSLDDKRSPQPELSNIPDILATWDKRSDAKFKQARSERLEQVRQALQPLHAERLMLEKETHRLQYEQALEPENTATRAALAQAQQNLADLQTRLQPFKTEFDRLSRQFWVSQATVKANKYDLSASRYRQVEQEPVFYEDPQVTIERILNLENTIADGMKRIQGMLKK